MKMIFTGPVEQITGAELVAWSQNRYGDNGAERYGSSASRKHLNKFSRYYPDLDYTKLTSSGSACFRADIIMATETFESFQQYQAFMFALSDFFLGEHWTTARQNPHLDGLPFYTLLSYGIHFDMLMPNEVTRRVIADFLNVASDGVEEQFFTYVRDNYEGLALGHLYTHLKNTFTNLLIRKNGSFYLTMDD